MSGHGEKLERKTDEAIAALLSCSTIAAAAKVVGVGEGTLRRWLDEPEFATRYRTARQQVMQHAISGIQGATAQAVETLVRLLKCGKPTVEAAVARTIIEHALKSAELQDVMARLEELERAIAGREQPTNRGEHGRA